MPPSHSWRRLAVAGASVALLAASAVTVTAAAAGGAAASTTPKASGAHAGVQGPAAYAGLASGSSAAPSPARAAALRHFTPPPPAQVTSTAVGATGAGFSAVIDHWSVKVGPGDATTCSIVGELFVPDAASAASPAPAILTTNGFGGSYTDQVPLAEFAAKHGFVVLTYSGLGFGGSGCDIELDSPAWDGEAASQLVSYLGDQPKVMRDGPDDPRVGMIGGSYGGEVQFAAASIDPRIDTIVPVITWNDLAYSLAPNNDSASFNWSKSPPGVLKWEWASLFFGDGLAEPYENPTTTPFPPSTCPGFDPAICTAFLKSVSAGYPTPDVVSMLRSDSVVAYYRNVRVPVMLMQGEDDTLFNVDEAVANLHLLRSVGDPVKLVLQSWGHSDQTPAAGEVSYTSTAQGYETLLILDWFDKYLKGASVTTGPPVEYFRPWVKYDASGSAEPAYGTAASWPVGSVLDLYLSGNGTLVRSQHAIVAGSEQFVNPPDGQPASYSETSAVQYESPFSSIPPTDPPGTYASFETPALATPIDSVGIPQLTVHLSAADTSSLSPLTEATVYTKIYDVAPSGSVTLVNRIVSPARLGSASGTFKLTLPGVVHQYAAGDRIELVIAATDQAYMGSRVADALTVTIPAGDPGVLALPVVAPSHEQSGGPRASGA